MMKGTRGFTAILYVLLRSNSEETVKDTIPREHNKKMTNNRLKKKFTYFFYPLILNFKHKVQPLIQSNIKNKNTLNFALLKKSKLKTSTKQNDLYYNSSFHRYLILD